jgi:AraC family transcriptional regulator
MMLVTPEQIPNWVPGDLTVDSASQGWEHLRIRGYSYKDLAVTVPPLQDYLIVVYKAGTTPMKRRCVGQWKGEHVGPGVVSLMTQAEPSDWVWSAPIEVLHVYISPQKFVQIASDALDNDVTHVELRDILKAHDPYLEYMARVLDAEAGSGSLGGKIFVEGITNQICVHILRKYAGEHKLRSGPHRGLTTAQIRNLTSYINDHMSENITLADLAAVVDASVYAFIRQFKISFGSAPHCYLMKRRVEKARELIGRRHIPIKLVAASCGFADQSHMNRLFKKMYDVTPGMLRKAASE